MKHEPYLGVWILLFSAFKPLMTDETELAQSNLDGCVEKCNKSRKDG